MPVVSELNGTGITEFVQAYELARAANEEVELTRFLPPPGHPHYAEVYGQLLARDLEHRASNGDAPPPERTVWNNGRLAGVRSGARPQAAAPSASPDNNAVTAQVGRVRQSGAPSDRSKSRRQAGAAGTGAVQGDSKKRPADAATDAQTEMPAAGTEFCGFRILAELGRGAFGRVYLAQQRDLASRYVVVKVSPDIFGESQALAQLQHTNIVPIYSVHRARPFQAVCMPYFGSTTLADLVHSWREREALPESGKDLVSTLCNRKSVTRSLQESNVSHRPANLPFPEAPAEIPAETIAELPEAGRPQGTAILEMLEGLSFVDAVLWIGSRLADGLSHAHDHGILHRDLKPANVLLTDEGQPMLLDFNVAEDTKLHREALAGGKIGGTLSYMAPEHIEAFQGLARSTDARSDVYSLGIILYEMLTRRLPFPTPDGSLTEVLPHLGAHRLSPPPRLRSWNKAISPAVEAIVSKCLESDPSKRYQSAHELREDLDRHRTNLPLKYAHEPSLRERAQKWLRRHPHLTSLTSIALLATLLVGSLAGWCIVRGQRLAELEAQDVLREFHEEAKTVQFLLNARSMDRDHLDEGLQRGRQALGMYQVVDNPAWQTQRVVCNLSGENAQRLRTELGDLLLLVSRGLLTRAAAAPGSAEKTEDLRTALRLNELAGQMWEQEPDCRALLAQRAELAELLGQAGEARRWRERAEQAPLRTARDYYLVGTERVAQGRYREALPLLLAAAEQEPQNFWARLVLGLCYDGLSQDVEARACYTTAIALWPEFPWAYFNRGLVYLRQNDFRNAAADFDRVAGMRPDFAETYINRAVARQGVKDYPAAIADLTHALELGAPHTRIYFMRARVRELAGDREAARTDLAEGLRRDPTDEKSWIARGIAKLSRDLPGALADFQKAAELNPRSLAALQNQAHVLSKLGRNQDAVRILDQVVELYPDFVPARAGRGVLRARLQQVQGAHEDADDSLARDYGPVTQYQVAGIFALTSKQNPDDYSEALRYLSSALRKGFGFDELAQDRDLDPIRERAEFRQLVNAARALQPASPRRQSESRRQ
jgi:serine/threonine protein kinase/tetratricopeptide (TPR) repeat protein